MPENETKPLKESKAVCVTSLQTGICENRLSRERTGSHGRFVVRQYTDRWPQHRAVKERGDIK